MTDVEPGDDERLCPQYWAVFSVGGSTGTYEVFYDRGMRVWRCTCRGSMFDPATPCKHIKRVRAHGCFGDGPNDFARVGMSICGKVPRMARRAGGRCRCGQPLFTPGYEGLPLKYSVMLGLSRPISDFELAELDQIWPGLRDAHARHWLVVPQTTIDNIQARLPEIQTQLGGVEERAAVIESVAETLAAGDRAEWERRQGVMTEINRSLELYRHQ